MRFEITTLAELKAAVALCDDGDRLSLHISEGFYPPRLTTQTVVLRVLDDGIVFHERESDVSLTVIREI